jgi:hypothetical protein
MNSAKVILILAPLGIMAGENCLCLSLRILTTILFMELTQLAHIM